MILVQNHNTKIELYNQGDLYFFFFQFNKEHTKQVDQLHLKSYLRRLAIHRFRLEVPLLLLLLQDQRPFRLQPQHHPLNHTRIPIQIRALMLLRQNGQH